MSAASRAPGKQRAADAESPAGAESVEVRLEHARMSHLGWAVMGAAAGVLLVMKLSTVGKMAGAVLLAVAAYHGYLFVRTLLWPPGTIQVTGDGVVLPRGLCRGRPETFAAQDIRHAFLLRRTVAWTTTAPVLVVEAGASAFTYPRDWFATDADQRRVVQAVLALSGRQSGA